MDLSEAAAQFSMHNLAGAVVGRALALQGGYIANAAHLSSCAQYQCKALARYLSSGFSACARKCRFARSGARLVAPTHVKLNYK